MTARPATKVFFNRLMEATSKKLMTDKLEFVFVEVEKFDKGEDELETDLDKWLYLLKNMSNLLGRPERLRDRIFTKLFDVAELAQLIDEDRINYIKAMNTERGTCNRIDSWHDCSSKQLSPDAISL